MNQLIIDRNVYWLSNAMDILDWEKSEWDQTPIKQYANFMALNSLGTVKLNVTNETNVINDENYEISVTIINTNKNIIAFMVNAKIINSNTKEPVLPQLWSDNWITLFPNQQTTINATFSIGE